MTRPGTPLDAESPDALREGIWSPGKTAGSRSDVDPARATLPSGEPLFLVLVLLGVTAAAVAAWLAGESRLVRVVPARQDVNLMGRVIRDATAETIRAAASQTGMRSFAALGGLFGLSMGLVGGLVRRSPRSAIVAGLTGLIVGIALSAPIALAMFRLHDRFADEAMPELMDSLLTHLGLWIPPGAVGGLALALGLGRRGRILPALAGGAAGAVLGTFLYEIVGAVAFPLAETNRPISTTATTRLLADLLLTLPASLIAAMAMQGGRGSGRPTDLASRTDGQGPG